MIFIMVFMAMAAGMMTLSSANAQTSANHSSSNTALNAALSGLECARYQIRKANDIARSSTGNTLLVNGQNTVSNASADAMWNVLRTQLVNAGLCTTTGTGDEILTRQTPAGDLGASFQLLFYRDADSPCTVFVRSIGSDDDLTRTVQMGMGIAKSADVLSYALAGRGRMWLAGDTTIHGDVYSSWDRADISPFNMTDDSIVEGSLNTVLAWQDILQEDYQMQTCTYDGTDLILDDGKFMASNGNLLDCYGNPITNSAGTAIDILELNFQAVEGQNIAVDGSGNPIIGYVNGTAIGPVTYGNPVETFDAEGDRVFTSDDELLGLYETVNYSQPDQTDVPGLSIADYDRTEIVSQYRSTSNIAVSTSASQYTGSLDSLGSTNGTRYRYEYFPHNADSYTSGSGLKIKRYIYKNQTFTNKTLPNNANALFINCTFNGTLFVDCSTSTSTNFNNVRFDDCTFNGVIATDVPNALSWQRNALYFTGSSMFNNQSSFQDFTILAPHFNVNLGNANNGEVQSDENILTGAIVGGIVDVRGNAEVYGTIISMANTTNYTSGYVTNIGATLGDGGSETSSIEDIGTITITPDLNQMLPSGIKAPVIFKPDMTTYTEVQ